MNLSNLMIAKAFCIMISVASAQVSPIERPNGALPPITTTTAMEVLDGEAREDALDAVEAYLNGIDSLSGRFLQVGPDGRPAEGEFYMRKPLRARFEYEPPSELLIVADGTWVALVDGEIDQVDRVPISATPLDIILRPDLDVRRDADPRQVIREGDYLIVNVRQIDAEEEGDLTLIFAEPALELRQWIVRDAAGRPTSVAFSQIDAGRRLDPDLFRIEDEERDDFFDGDER